MGSPLYGLNRKKELLNIKGQLIRQAIVNIIHFNFYIQADDRSQAK